MFKRRMGLRQYFKELKMNMDRIKKSKDSKAGIRNTEKKDKKAKKPKEENKEEALSKSSLGASPADKEKKPKTKAPQRSNSKGPAVQKTPAAGAGPATPAKKKVVKK